SDVTFTTAATNRGPATATGVTITNPLPPNSIFVSAASSQGTCTNLGSAVVCALGTLGNGAAATMNVTVRPTLPGLVTNTASGLALQPDHALANNVASAIAMVTVPDISIGDATVAEGPAGTTTNAVFSLQLSSASSQTIMVGFAAEPMSANAGSDFLATNGVVVFAPGQTARSIAVTVLGDALNESTEFFRVVLTNPVNVTVAGGVGSGSILDDDPSPALTINDVSVTEANSGTTNLSFTVTLTPASGQVVSVDYATTDGTALAGSDYLATVGTMTFNPGETNHTISVPVLGDTLNESNETFFINLTGAVNAGVSKSQGTGTIVNNDLFATISTAGATLAAENCAPTNGVIDPNETVTVNFSLRNISTGGANTTNLVATLVQSGGITAPSVPQNYGALVAGGAAVSRSFTFTANGKCGDTLVAVLQLQDGAGNLGTVTNLLTTGKIISTTNTFTNSTSIAIMDAAAAAPYPSTITVAGLPSSLSKVTVTLSNLGHAYPDDVDILLVGPGGQKVVLISDAGGGDSIAGVTLTFDDAAASELPDAMQITSGNYRPTDFDTGDPFPAPAPSAPYSTSLSAFNGTDPNGTWSLYAADDSGGDDGTIAGGWSLALTAVSPPVCCGSDSSADIAVGKTASAGSIVAGSNLTYTISVTNRGPNAASDVLLTDPLPIGVSFVSATNSAGSCSNLNGTVVCNLGTMSSGAVASTTIIVTATTSGTVTNTCTASARTPDPNAANNSGSVVTTVLPAPPVAAFLGGPLAGLRPLTVNFTDSSGGVITSRFWNFGSGSTTNTAATNVAFTYNSAGTNTVSLTVSGPGGSNTLTRTNYVLVTNPPPQLSISPPSLDFSAVVLGQTNTLSFQVLNGGGQTLTGAVTALLPFTIRGGSPFSVPPGQTSVVSVGFAPTNAASFNNAVVFTSNGGNGTNAVTGTGVTPAQLSVSPAGLNFGTVAVGTNGQASFVVTNLGGGPLSNGVANASTGSFTILSGTPFVLAGFGSTNVVVRFAPTNAGSYSNLIVFTSSGGSSSNPAVGSGALPPVAGFTVSPTNGVSPLVVTFDSASTGNITNHTWDFGNGATVDTVAPGVQYTYPDAGIYTVRLTVSGPGGADTAVRTNCVVVYCCIRITSVQKNGASVFIRFDSVAGRNYRLEYVNTLDGSGWTTVADVTGTGGSVEIVDPGAMAATRIYRVRQLP
ncbi:MAG TPA: Calx-beta domain-containing protein, partial [Verrucomicrobiae bacterium]